MVYRLSVPVHLLREDMFGVAPMQSMSAFLSLLLVLEVHKYATCSLPSSLSHFPSLYAVSLVLTLGPSLVRRRCLHVRPPATVAQSEVLSVRLFGRLFQEGQSLQKHP